VLAALHDALGKIVELRSLVQMPADPAFGTGSTSAAPSAISISAHCSVSISRG